MSLDRRTFMYGVAAGLVSYESTKPNLLSSPRETDRAVGPTPGVFKPQTDLDLSGILRRLGQPQLVVQLDPAAHPDDTIKPGQPISLTWVVYDPFSTVSTFPPRPSERFSSYRITLFDGGNRVAGPTTQRRFLTRPDGLPRDFYKITGRDRLVTAELSDSTGAVASEARFYLLVVNDNAPTWEWGLVATRNHWNRDHYTLTGTLRNNADFGNLKFRPILTQTEQMGSAPVLDLTQAIPVSGAEHTLAPHETRILFFPAIQQNWPWFDRATLLQFGPFSRMFNYSVNITASDDFDNRYEGASDTWQVSVEVEQAKLNEEALALAALINGIILSVISIWYQWAAILAAGSLVAAERLTAAALDPPSPDFDYFTVVRQKSTQASDDSPAGRLLGLILQIAGTPEMLSATESKMIGATLKKSSVGLITQQRSYTHAIRSLNTAARQLGKLLPEALQELHSREVDKSRQSAREVFANGVPDELLKTLRPAGLSREAEIMFVKAARNPDVIKQLPDIDTALTNMVKQAILLTLTLQNEMPTVLRARPKRVPKIQGRVRSISSN